MELLLLKALSEGDFHVCAHLLNSQLRSEDKIAQVFAISEALETCNYQKFWVLLGKSNVKQLVPSFVEKGMHNWLFFSFFIHRIPSCQLGKSFWMSWD